jgi:hypothetical protein
MMTIAIANAFIEGARLIQIWLSFWIERATMAA